VSRPIGRASLSEKRTAWAERHRIVRLPLRFVGQASRLRLERELVAVFGVGHCLRALHDLQPEIEGVAPEDVAHVVAADDHHVQPDFVGDRLEARGAHLARRSDREAIPRDDEGLAAMNACAKVGHQVAERARLPAFVQRLEALGHAVGGRRDLIGIDRVELLLLARDFQIPDDQRAAADHRGRRRGLDG